MVISLYTSRVILNVLGVDDYGINNVVSGFVTMFSLFTSAIAVATIRFITYALGEGNIENQKKVMATSNFLMLALTILIVFVTETAGVWFVNNKMVIPLDRLNAANWVFQFCVVNFAVTLIAMPYQSSVIAHEHMSTFAKISILDSVTKLSIALSISYSPIDKLIYYGLMIALGAIIVQFIYIYYSRKKFAECRAGFHPDKEKLKEMFGYTGWNVLGGFAAIFRDQGGNILANVFFGPVVNAARGVALQVCYTVNSFVGSFQNAVNPQITKTYAAHNYEYHNSLVLQSCKFSYLILLVFSIPVFFNATFLLEIWLGQVPEYTVLFIRIILVYILSEAIANPLLTACSATGKMKLYELSTAPITLLNIPISYILLLYGATPESILWVMVIISILTTAIKSFVLQKMTTFSVKEFFNRVIVRLALCTVVAVIVPFFFVIAAWADNIISIIICTISTVLSVLYIGCTNEERKLATQAVVNKLKRK